MLRNLLVLPDGTEIYSGTDERVALQRVTYTECVNSETELTLGSACSNCIEVSIISPSGALSISAGTEVEYYKVDEEGGRTRVGLFTLETPTKSSANIYKVTAYDRMTWTDIDLTDWFAGLTAWPYKLYDFTKLVCSRCGLELKNTSLLNGDYEIKEFEATGITGRQILKWVGELCAKFCRITPEGELEFAWYTECAESIGPTSGSDMNGNKVHGYFQKSLSYEDYEITAIEKVQIKQSDSDVGVIWPDSEESVNTYVISSNYLVSADTEDELKDVVRNIYNAIKDTQYTPGKVSVEINTAIRAGMIVSVMDINGTSIKMYVMSREESGQKSTYESTGSVRRDSVTETNNQNVYKKLSGRVLEISKSVDGLKVANKEIDGKMSEIELNIEGIRAETAAKYTTQESFNASVNNLQAQIDGAVETYTGNAVPTLINSPASEWSENEKETHIGDLYIVNSAGGDYAGFYYRFEQVNGLYQWTLLKDTEITKALQDAADANKKAEQAINEGVTKVEVMYALSDSTTNEPTTGWSLMAPEWTPGKYMWSKTVTTYGSGETSTSAPTCISGATGKEGKDGEDATTLRIESSRGTVFKNNEVSTVLSAVIYKGSKRITDITSLKQEYGKSAYIEWSWQRMDEDTFGVIVSTDSRIGNDGFSFTLSPQDVDTKVVFACKLLID